MIPKHTARDKMSIAADDGILNKKNKKEEGEKKGREKEGKMKKEKGRDVKESM